jgi:hypothetical protein
VTHFLPLFSLSIMYQSNFALNMEQYEHVKAVRIKMSRAYSRLRSNLYRDHYKKYFKGVDAHNAEEIARAKAIGRETVPKGYGPEQWKLICDSFDDESWKVNIDYYTN